MHFHCGILQKNLKFIEVEKKLVEEEEEKGKLFLEVNCESLSSTLDGITLWFKDLSGRYDLVFYQI